ncbi:MAG: hypothetical protein ACI912_001603, partial [Marinobacter psychrophilus]
SFAKGSFAKGSFIVIFSEAFVFVISISYR